MNPFPYSDDNKRYHTLSYHYMHTFGERLFKAAIDAGFTCPTLDGTKGTNGCSFCLGGAGEFAGNCRDSVTKQLLGEKERIFKKQGAVGLIAYFRVHTNTYADTETLCRLYTEALSFPGVVGLSIGTRADCITEENADLLAALAEKSYVTVELGLQTVHDKTAVDFGRGYDYKVFENAYRLLKSKNIRTCIHLINGLKGETRDMMVESARKVGLLRPDAVKLHLLHILKGTRAAKEYEAGEIIPLRKDQYVDIICRQLEVLPPETVMERITGDGPKAHLIAPKWSLDKISVLAAIDKELAARSTYQGMLF
ncbi:MAG: TIGR01212 family radical SAM protein [Clostridia bacterium]|nr:TIGR01212 family radical SAM protein [Clostridia bacterium]